MNETTQETATPQMTLENAREVFINVATAVTYSRGGEIERQRLLEILQNNDIDFRDILATSLKENFVIEAFSLAGMQNDLNLLQAFHDVGMNVDARSFNSGWTALISACYNGHEESIRWLLDRNANANVQDGTGMTALMHACSNRNTTIVEMLLQKNANPDIQNKNGRTALMFASRDGHKEIVQLLLNYNANIELKNKGGKTALEMATNEDIKELLRNFVSAIYVLK